MYRIVLVRDGVIYGSLGPYHDRQAAQDDAQQVADSAQGRAQVFVVADRHTNPSTSYPAPQALREELLRGLRWLEAGHGGRGLVVQTIEDARRIVETGQITREKRERMGPWLRRHRVDKQGQGFRPGEPGYPSPGRVAWALWGGDPAVAWIGKGERPWLKPPRRQNKAPASDTPARPDERIKGSARNAPGSAATDGGPIRLSEGTNRALRAKVRAHNAGDPLHRASLRQLQAVYRRGAGAYSTSHSPVVRSRHQWGMARVNAFLHLLQIGSPKNPRYVQDDDLIGKTNPSDPVSDKIRYLIKEEGRSQAQAVAMALSMADRGELGRLDNPAQQIGLFDAPPPSKKAPPKKKKRKASLFQQYGSQGAPRPGERGYRPVPKPANPAAWGGSDPYALADRLIDASQVYMNEPGFYWSYAHADPDTYTETEEDDLFETLPDWIGVPDLGGDGQPLPEKERDAIALYAVRLAMEADPDRGLVEYGRVLTRKRGRRGTVGEILTPLVDGREIPTWAAKAILGDALAKVTPGYSMKTRLVNVSKEQAKRFIEQHHSALPYLNPKGLMFALGAVRPDGRLVAVATAGTPTGRWRRISPHRVLELTRVASDGTTPNAASQLVARLLRLVKAGRTGRAEGEGPDLFVTYQLAQEEGATYRALADLGLRPTEKVGGQKAKGARSTAGPASLAEVDKIRWECCRTDPAGEPDWSLLEPGEE